MIGRFLARLLGLDAITPEMLDAIDKVIRERAVEVMAR